MTIKFNYNQFLYENDFLYLCPELFLCCATCILLIWGVFMTTDRFYGYPLLQDIFPNIAIILCLHALFLLWTTPFINGILCNYSLCKDALTFYFSNIILFGTLCFFAITKSSNTSSPNNGQSNNFEYNILFLLTLCSMLFLTAADDFLTIYLTIELSALCFYVLAASKRYMEFSTEAGLKYFLLGAFSSGILLFGISFLYGYTGMTNISDYTVLQSATMTENTITMADIGFLFLFFGFLFKLTAAPFHIWAPDVYEGSPIRVTTFFATIPKASLLVPFYKLQAIGFLHNGKNVSTQLLFLTIFLSILVGTFAAFGQQKIKRLLAYSSISHIGYILCGFYCQSLGGLQSICIYYPIYMITSLGIFSICLVPLWKDTIKYITDFALLGKRNSLVAICFALYFFSLAGIPPLGGFYSKSFLFFALLYSGGIVLTIWGVLASIWSCYYYIRFVRIFYFEKEKNSFQYRTIPQWNSYMMAFAVFFLLFILLYPYPLDSLSSKTAVSLVLEPFLA